MPFIQIIEFTTSRPDEVEALVDEWRAKTRGRRTAQRGTFTQDRDRRDVYVQIVESLAARRLRPTLTCPRRPSWLSAWPNSAMVRSSSATSMFAGWRRCNDQHVNERNRSCLD